MAHLAEHLREHGPMSARDAVGWTVRLAGALAEMHGRGDTHGRVSDAAVCIDGSAPTAWGRLLPPEDADEALGFRSERQLSGEPTQPNDDVWAAGVLLYRLLTGVFPFGESPAEQVRERIGSSRPAPLAVFDAGDDALQRVLDRVLTRSSPMASAEALRAALLDWDPSLAELEPLGIHDPVDDEDSSDAVPTSLYRPMDDPRIAEMARRRVARDEDAATGDHRPDRKPATPTEPAPARSERSVSGMALTPGTPSGRAASEGPDASEPSSHRGKRAPRSSGGRRPLVWMVGAACVAAGAALAIYILGDTERRAATAATSAPPERPSERPGAAPTATAAAPSETSAPRAEKPPTNDEEASGADEGETTVPPSDRLACVEPLFPARTFAAREPNLSFLCETTDPTKGASKLRTQVVHSGAGRGATPAMREWSALGWYGLAAFVLARERCCPDPAPLSGPSMEADCPVVERLEVLAEAAERGDEEAAEEALDAFDAAIGCVFSAGEARVWGRVVPPRTGHRIVFSKTLRRALDP